MRLSHRFKVASKKNGIPFWLKKHLIKRSCQERGKSAYSDAIKSMIDLEYKSCLAGITPLLASKFDVLTDPTAIHNLISTEISRTRVITALKIPTTADVIINTPAPPTAPLPPKHERYISMGCAKDVLNVSEPAKKTVTQKMAGFITSLTNRVRGVFNA